jgi:hypothetical protein
VVHADGASPRSPDTPICRFIRHRCRDAKARARRSKPRRPGLTPCPPAPGSTDWPPPPSAEICRGPPSKQSA